MRAGTASPADVETPGDSTAGGGTVRPRFDTFVDRVDTLVEGVCTVHDDAVVRADVLAVAVDHGGVTRRTGTTAGRLRRVGHTYWFGWGTKTPRVAGRPTGGCTASHVNSHMGRMDWLLDPGRLAVAVGSGVAAIATSFLVTAGSPRWVVFAATKTVLFLLPDPLFRFGIEQLGDLSQPLLVVGSTLLCVGAYGLAALGAIRLGEASGRTRGEAVFATLVAQTLGGFVLTIAPVPSLLGGVAGAGVVGVSGVGGRQGHSASRRGLLRAGGTAAALFGAGGLFGLSQLGGSDQTSEGPVDDQLVSRLLETATERSLATASLDGLVSRDFYEVDINPSNPRVEQADWSLRVTGAVEEPTELTFDDLTELPMEHRFVSLRCVGDSLNGRKLDTALWTGVPIGQVLDRAGIEPEACCVLFRAADDYYQEFPAEALTDGLLAVRMNGRPLPTAHGAPVRALIPGHWGEINVKWLTEIELLTEPQQGYWEKRGWHGTGPVNTVAKLHEVRTDDGQVTLGGYAYAGTRGISAVEISTDGGETWNEAELSDPLPSAVPADADPDDPAVTSGTAQDGWRQYRYEYTAAESHEVVVRAREADGTLQPNTETSPFPRGASGWVSQQVDP